MRTLKNTEMKLVAGGYTENITGREEPSTDLTQTMRELEEIAEKACESSRISSISIDLGSSTSGEGSVGNRFVEGSGSATHSEHGSATIICNTDTKDTAEKKEG